MRDHGIGLTIMIAVFLAAATALRATQTTARSFVLRGLRMTR
jgi:hypothetical protein